MKVKYDRWKIFINAANKNAILQPTFQWNLSDSRTSFISWVPAKVLTSSSVQSQTLTPLLCNTSDTIVRELYKCCTVGTPCADYSARHSPTTSSMQQFLPKLIDADEAASSIKFTKSTVASVAAEVTSCLSPISSTTNLTSSKFLLQRPILNLKQLSPHSRISFNCTYCPFRCIWKYDLKLHLRQKHGIHKNM